MERASQPVSAKRGRGVEGKAGAERGGKAESDASVLGAVGAGGATRADLGGGDVAAHRYDGVELQAEPRHRAEVLRELPIVVAAVTGLLALLGVQMWLHRRRPLGGLAELPAKQLKVRRKADGDTR